MARFVQKMRGPVSFVEVGIKHAANDADDTTPRITSGAGVPASTVANGSIYLRSDAGAADSAIYARIGGAWVAIDGT